MIIKAKVRGTPGQTAWIWSEHICAVSAGVDGLAWVMTLDGKSYYLTEKAQELVDRIMYEPA